MLDWVGGSVLPLPQPNQIINQPIKPRLIILNTISKKINT